MKKHTTYFVLLNILAATMLFLFTGCEDDSVSPRLPDNSGRVTIEQGVWGDVLLWEGNHMPTTDGSSSGTITPVEREVVIYKAVTDNEVEHSGHVYSLYKKINGELVTTVESDDRGFYQVALPPGDYSIFSKEEDSLYFGGMASNQYLMHATVREGAVTKFQIDINHKAAF